MLGLSTATLISSTAALAQVPAPNETIIVTAPRQERTARSEQKAAPNIVSIQSAEAVPRQDLWLRFEVVI